MTRRGYIRLFSFIVMAFVCLSAFGIKNMITANNYKARLELNYQQSLNELAECLDGIETNLTKSIYANSSSTFSEISMNLFSETSTAKDTLSRLPVDQMNLEGTFKFLSQASDYAAYLSNKINSNETITEEEHENLNKLLSYATKYKNEVEILVQLCNDGGQITNRNIKSPINGTDVAGISIDFTNAEEAFEAYPILLYDGPFADAVLNRESQLLKKADAISLDKAKGIAAMAMNCNKREALFESEDNGKLPCYVFTYGQYTAGITKYGGYVSYILFGGKISNSSIAQGNATNIAKSYLNKLGYTNMQTSYYAVTNNICLVNFAYTDSGVICYSDLIKIGVSMDTGKIVSLEAKGFLTNHIERSDMTAKISLDEAQSNISKYLSVKNTKKCIIPADNGKELLCWEFHVESSKTGEEALIYVNANTGREEKIMLLLYSDSGTMTK